MDTIFRMCSPCCGCRSRGGLRSKRLETKQTRFERARGLKTRTNEFVRGTQVVFLAALLVGLLISAPAFARDVEVWEGTIMIPTYPLGPEDVNPRFPALEGGIIYPYTMQDNLSAEKVDRTYRAFFLENEYLKVTCLPEIGSRLHSVFDKTTGEEMFYTNDVIKPGLIGLRGAWISGGVEWNDGPQGHTVTSFSPADATYVEHKDGSASLVLGSTNQVTRTRWTVRLTLHPGRAYLDERIRISNPTDTPKPYYFWNNTAFPCHEGTRFIYPMTLGTDHGGTNFFSWPIHEGKDLTWLKNYDRPTSIFAYECAFDFFGAYDVTRDQGIVQVADHNLLIGKKAWTWGMSDDGLAAMANLTDNAGGYIEVQSGPLATQADYGLLNPHQHREWQEYWYPIHGLGDGFTYANKDIAINVFDTGSAAVEVRYLATGVFKDASISVAFVDDQGAVGDAYTGTTDLAPDRIGMIHMDYDLNLDGPISTEGFAIAAHTEDGRLLASFETPLDIPEKTAPELPKPTPEAERTAEEHYRQGVVQVKRLHPSAARATFEKALEKDPNHAAALRDLGMIDLKQARWDDAVEHLTQAVALNADDGLAWYYLGVAHLNRDDLAGARKAAYHAVRTLDARSLGYDLAGRVSMREGDFHAAIDAFEKAVLASPHDDRARNHLILAQFAAGRYEAEPHAEGHREAALLMAEQRVEINALDLVPLAVVYSADDDMSGFRMAVRRMMGEPQFELMENALVFAELGLDLTAGHFAMANYTLEMAGTKHNVVPRYYARYFGIADAASSIPEGEIDYAFPARPEAAPVLEQAVAERPKDAVAHLLLGNLYAGLNRVDEAVPHWEQAAALDASLNVAQRNLGLHAWKKENDLPKAESWYRAAIAARPSDQPLYRDLVDVLDAQGRLVDAIAPLENIPSGSRLRYDVTLRLAQAYIDASNPGDTIALLNNTRFSNWEGNTQSWRLHVRAHVDRGKTRLDAGELAAALEDFEAALAYPEHLGVGRPANPQEAESLYWKGKALAAIGREAEAREAWQQGAAQSQGNDTQDSHIALCKQALDQ
jgi:tetratricopeptide (TPR) repeat protein